MQSSARCLGDGLTPIGRQCRVVSDQRDLIRIIKAGDFFGEAGTAVGRLGQPASQTRPQHRIGAVRIQYVVDARAERHRTLRRITDRDDRHDRFWTKLRDVACQGPRVRIAQQNRVHRVAVTIGLRDIVRGKHLMVC